MIIDYDSDLMDVQVINKVFVVARTDMYMTSFSMDNDVMQLYFVDEEEEEYIVSITPDTAEERSMLQDEVFVADTNYGVVITFIDPYSWFG